MKKINVILIGFDLEVIELINSKSNYILNGYIDLKKANYNEYTYLGKDNINLIESNFSNSLLILAMDLPHIRKKMFCLYKDFIIDLLVSNSSKISLTAKIGKGTVVQANVFISSYVRIGKGCFINYNSNIHHETLIGDFTIIAPSSTILGRVNIGSESYIGSGSIIKENVNIGSNVIVGAGAVVVKNIPDNCIVVGNPAKIIKYNSIK